MNPHQPHSPYRQPAIPRDPAAASFSELVPIGSSKINLIKSPATLLLVLAAAIAPLTIIFLSSMQGAGQERGFLNLSFSIVFFVTFALALIVYLYARPGRSLLPYLWGFALVAGLMTLFLFRIPFVFDGLNFLFTGLTGIEPAGSETNAGLGWAFTSHFIGVGFTEELFKAIPIFIGALVGLAVSNRPESAIGPVARFFRIRGPLDGVIMGAFAGAAFIVLETAGLYLPKTFAQDLATGGTVDSALASALFLYFPRVIGGAVGHMAYSAILGYFIGLAVLRPRFSLLFILGGLLLAAALHGLWNGLSIVARSEGDVYYLLIPAGLSALFFAAVLLKARQLHASRYGEGPETLGSIIIDRSGASPVPHAVLPPQPGAFPPYPQPHFPAGYPPPPLPASPPPPAAPPAPMTEQPLQLELDGIAIPLREGQAIDLAAEPALEGKGAGVRAEVVPHPRRPGVLGLRNAGDLPWTAHLRNGRAQQIDKSQNVRLAEGVRIDFGDGLIGAVKARLT